MRIVPGTLPAPILVGFDRQRRSFQVPGQCGWQAEDVELSTAMIGSPRPWPEHDVGGLPANAGQRLGRRENAVLRHMFLEQSHAGGDGVLCLGAIEADAVVMYSRSGPPPGRHLLTASVLSKLRVAILTLLSVACAEDDGDQQLEGPVIKGSVVGARLL